MALFTVHASIIVKSPDGELAFPRTVPAFIVEAGNREEASRVGLSVVKTGIGSNFLSATADSVPYAPRA